MRISDWSSDVCSSDLAKRVVEQAIADGVAAGAELVLDGRGLVVPGLEDGFYAGPSLLDHVTVEMEFWKKEVFGPARGIMRLKDLDEAIEVTNAHEYGNGAVIFTRSKSEEHTSELQSLMRTSYAVFCLKKKKK